MCIGESSHSCEIVCKPGVMDSGRINAAALIDSFEYKAFISRGLL